MPQVTMDHGVSACFGTRLAPQDSDAETWEGFRVGASG